MRKRITACIGLLLVLCLALTPVYAGEEEDAALVITTADQLLAFAENCRLDSYSQGLSVRLDADLDLTGMDWEGIPVFCGDFDGGGHTITGLSVTGDGSQKGLFRTLTETARVHDLNLQGTVAPQGSRSQVGGIAGVSAGQITDCTFEGTVSGVDAVGGIVGCNQVTGLVENCRVSGSVSGSHFVGGVAGENAGVVRGCTNEAAVNTTEQQNQVALSDVTLETLTGAESLNNVTDVGGVTGVNTGVVHSCENRGDVGYRQMGYNVGGIAGSQSGYLADCVNRGTVQGRKEVGGIVGQLEPVTRVDYSEDALQMLQDQLNALNQTAGQVSGHLQSGVTGVSDGLDSLKSQAQSARDAAAALVPKPGELPDLPDRDSIQAAKNDLTSRIQNLNQTVSGMLASVEGSVDALTGDLQAITDQMNAINQTVNQAGDYLGWEFTDVSDEDTADDQTAKVEGCVNEGEVYADWNAGGIAGAMAPENDLDTLTSVEFYGEKSLHLYGQMRAVLLNCTNSAPVYAGKQNAGGTVGWAAMGLTKGCVNTGDVGSESADRVGGIAGSSAGFVRDCSAKCRVTGDAETGGIAGRGTVVTGCRAMVLLTGTREQYGAVLGSRDEDTDTENPVQDNFYLPVGQDPGGVDGVSYADQAQPLDLESFLALEGLPDLFRTVTLTFVQEDGSRETCTVPTGGALDPSEIPALSGRGRWGGLEEIDLSQVTFDATFQAVYDQPDPVLTGSALREDGSPVVLVQGASPALDSVTLTGSQQAPEIKTGQTWLESWALEQTADAQGLTIRYLPPEGRDTARLRVWVLTDSGWRTAQTTVDGSRLVFALNEGETTFAVVQAPPLWPLYAGGAGILVLAAGAAILIARRRKRKTTV